MRLFVVLLTVGLGGCQCGARLSPTLPAELVASPAHLVFNPAFVGYPTRANVELTNRGRSTAALELSTSPPFSLSMARVELGAGMTEAVAVTFSPSSPGSATGTLWAGGLVITLEAEGLAVPECRSSEACVDSSFDATAGACRETRRPEGAACETACVTGTCVGGACVGALRGCDDGDACTVDGCGPGGCTTAPVVCPAPRPCTAPTCDGVTGCGVTEAPDGTLCGPDDCLASQVDVCIAGQCVQRARPATGRCTNRWLPVALTSRAGHMTAFDVARGRLVLFGGEGTSTFNDTWEWDGNRWEQRLPAASPPPRKWGAMAWDAARQRVVLFGGYRYERTNITLGDTWEWDGVAWVERLAAVSPPPDFAGAMAWDATRRRAVLFHAASGDLWEWDGVTWLRRTPAVQPAARHFAAMAWDATRRRVVLFGGDSAGADTWEWDGSAWHVRAPAQSPPARSRPSMTWDSVRRRVLLFGGLEDLASSARADLWEWDGTTWVERPAALAPRPRFDATMSFDPVRGRAVLVAGQAADTSPLADTWTWDGAVWRLDAPLTPRPPPRGSPGLAWDAARQRLVLFGGYNVTGRLDDAWEWDGSAWFERTPAVRPPGRSSHGLAYDVRRQRLVMYGGHDGSSVLGDTWELDGATWLPRAPATSPAPRMAPSMAWDPISQRVVLFGGIPFGGGLETWSWDGASWADQGASAPAYTSALAFDVVAQRLLLVGSRYGEPLSAWSWTGSAWSAQAAQGPAIGGTISAATDPNRRRVVVFGARAGGGSFTAEWDGATWRDLDPVTTPPATWEARLAYDEARQRLILYDGYDTWRYLP